MQIKLIEISSFKGIKILFCLPIFVSVIAF